MSASAYPSADLVDAAPPWLLESWYRELPAPRTDAEVDIMEHIATRAEQLGLVKYEGRGKP